MKVNSSYLFLAAIIFLVMVCLLCSATTVRPYSPANRYSNYEGFSVLGYDSGSVADSNQNNMITPSTSDCKKVSGFDGLFCKPYAADTKIDPFADTPGNLTCFGSSSGLSNSKGSLCLSEQQKNMLSTRGGNQTGAQSQIGN